MHIHWLTIPVMWLNVCTHFSFKISIYSHRHSQVLLELARNRNKIPLPKSIAGPGIPLPPEEDTLISPNYQLAIPKKQTSQSVEETEEDAEGVEPDPNPTQEPKTDLPHNTPPQRVSFPLGVKRPKWSLWMH